MSTRGVFLEGRFSACGDGHRGAPQCMGRAACNCEGPQCGCCTCPTFTAAEMAFAKEHRLTIERTRDMPIEWQSRRGARVHGPRWEALGPEGRCSICLLTCHVVRGPEPAAICEPCARLVLSMFAERRAVSGERKLVLVQSDDGARARGGEHG